MIEITVKLKKKNYKEFGKEKSPNKLINHLLGEHYRWEKEKKKGKLVGYGIGLDDTVNPLVLPNGLEFNDLEKTNVQSVGDALTLESLEKANDIMALNDDEPELNTSLLEDNEAGLTPVIKEQPPIDGYTPEPPHQQVDGRIENAGGN